MSKIFFDANILLDILIPSRANHQQSIEAYSIICDKYDTLATSENILTTIEYIASKNGTDCQIIWRFFKSLKNSFELYSFGDILEESLEIYYQACRENKKIDFEDLLQLQCAIKNACNAFITQDKGIHNLDIDIEVLGLDDIK
ncbi:MAG TPA: PIN domain-containing protein [Campylobacterales bacterium]|nr:PIN domain-containing protein [Campylobacterales bacterium]